ncbi:Highly reducing polyketide synthase apmlA like protein [Verticillium longisporum]|nr:Highly reducing polyketide synthase apmlA like protein [Verticillium longisporum]
MGEPIRDKPLHGDQIPAAHLQPPIAVVGMGCRLPGNSNSPQALWQFISNGSVADNVPPTSRFRYATHYDGSGRAGTTPSPGAMFLGDEVDIAAFDAAFFNTSHHEAGSIDPQQRQLLEVIYECLENSGETLERIRGPNVGCLVANNGCEYESGTTRDPEDQIPGRSTGCGRSILANRVSHFLDITGPSIAIDTACSGTLVAVDMACRYLQFQQADAMIVAGALLYLDPSAQQDRGPMNGALSTSGRCHTFDAKADGYMRAEGVNAVYLKRLDDAIRDGDPIRAVIRGSATTGDGRTPSLTQPNPEAQANAIRAAYRNAGITDFSATGYVECHGTGTLAGDPLEITGLASAFASTRPVDQPLIIGSIKSNIGHSECAAGLSGLIKAVMAVERGVIPGNPTFITPNPKIDFEGSGVRASRTAMPWPSYAAVPRRASVNSFGFGGSNAHVVLEAAETFIRDAGYRKTFKTVQDQPKPYTSNQNVPRKGRLRILTFSANDRETLPRNVRAVSDHLRDPYVNAQVDDVAYTLSDRRTHHFHRGFVVADSLDFDHSKIITGKQKAQPPRIGFVFTGQGAQWSQMGKGLIENIPLARSVIDDLDLALQALPNAPRWTLLAELTEMRDTATLRCPEFSQPLVTALQIALLAVLQDWGIVGHKVLGHSSGEIAAAVAANLITPAEAIKTAYLRGQAAKRQSSDENLGMMAVGVSASAIERYLRSDVHVACFNSPMSLTLSGPVSNLESIRKDLQNDGHFARLLQVDLAYHSTFMREVANDYHKMLQEHCPSSGKHLRGNSMLSSVTGHAMSSQIGPEYWKANMVNPVRFAAPAAEMLSGPDACDFIIEVGPSGALAGPLSQIIKSLPGGGKNIQYAAAASRGSETLAALFEVAGKVWTRGGPVKLAQVNAYDRPSILVDLPNYQWNHSRRYWREGLSTEEYRHRPFISHELLGSKVLSTTWQFPTWAKVIHLSDLPWLRDHRVNGEVIFPTGAYVAMAAEAIRQSGIMTRYSSGTQPKSFAYRMKDVNVLERLVLEEAEGSRIRLILSPVHDSAEQWHTFTIQSYCEMDWVNNCTGYIRIDEKFAGEPSFPRGALAALTRSDALRGNNDFAILTVGERVAEDKAIPLLANILSTLNEEGQLLVTDLDQATANRVKEVLEEAGCSSIKDLAPSLSRGAILASPKQVEGLRDLAAIKVALHLGAEVYVGISNEDGHTLLQDEVPIPPSRIIAFDREGSSVNPLQSAGEVMFDVAFGSFSEIHLVMAWKHVAEDGTLVLTEQTENSTQVTLSLEPFTRGASFRVLNAQNIPKDTLILNQLLTETLGLLRVDSSLSSLSPKVFGYDQIENAVRWMKAEKFARAILSRIPGQDVMVQIQPEPRSIKFAEHACYLLIGGLRGLCGSIAIDWARLGAKHLAVMSRSGYDDETSQRVLRDVEGMGCHIDLLQGDITILDDVQRVLSETSVPIRGILQGSMVLRDRPFPAMTIEEFHQAAGCKITGTWNIHNASQDLGLDLDFFTLLSSIASVLGGMAQANYAAGCSFLDAFAAYRRGLGLPAFSVNLGIIGEVGYMSRDEALLERHIGSVTTSIDEDLMRQIIRYTVLQQSEEPVSHSATSNIVTGIAVPQSGDSYLRLDKRFSHLFVGGDAQPWETEGGATRDTAHQARELKALLATQPKTADRGVVLELAIAVVSDYITHAMHLSEPVEPERSLAMYGIDSLAAVAFRNWARMELGAGLSTGDVTTAPSLVALCERIVDGYKE